MKTPKRNNTIYKEIESFADYELTQCVAYEMAIRNDEVIKLVNSLSKKFNNDDFSKLRSYGLIYKELVDYGYLDKYPFFDKPIQQEKKGAKKIDISKMSDYSFYDKDRNISNALKNNIEFSQYTIKGEFTDSLYNSTADIHYKRPLLILEDKREINITFNMNLPRKELELQLKHILDNYDSKIVKSSLELLGEVLQQAEPTKGYPKKPKPEKYADLFFVYDYVKARLKKIKYFNDIAKHEHNEKISEIKRNKSYSSFDKKIQLAELAKEHHENIIDTSIQNIFEEHELLKPLDISSSNTKAYYYVIKPYIDDCKYKELLTGVSSI